MRIVTSSALPLPVLSLPVSKIEAAIEYGADYVAHGGNRKGE